MTEAGWTRKRPTEEGYYWRKGPDTWKARSIVTELVRIRMSPNGYPNMEVFGTDQYSPRFYDEENIWIGPLEVPQ